MSLMKKPAAAVTIAAVSMLKEIIKKRETLSGAGIGLPDGDGDNLIDIEADVETVAVDDCGVVEAAPFVGDDVEVTLGEEEADGVPVGLGLVVGEHVLVLEFEIVDVTESEAPLDPELDRDETLEEERDRVGDAEGVDVVTE